MGKSLVSCFFWDTVYISSVSVPGALYVRQCDVEGAAKRISQMFLAIFPQRLNILNKIVHAHCMFIFTQNY